MDGYGDYDKGKETQNRSALFYICTVITTI